MSLDITLHNLDDSIIQVFAREAAAHGTTPEQEMCEVLRKAAEDKMPVEERLRSLRQHFRARYGQLPGTTTLIRQERDDWGA